MGHLETVASQRYRRRGWVRQQLVKPTDEGDTPSWPTPTPPLVSLGTYTLTCPERARNRGNPVIRCGYSPHDDYWIFDLNATAARSTTIAVINDTSAVSNATEPMTIVYGSVTAWLVTPQQLGYPPRHSRLEVVRHTSC